MLTKHEQRILDALCLRASQEGIEIVTVEIVGAKKAPTIRVYIDTPHGVAFDELTSAQVWINEIMDELDPFPGAYTLEISSPGIDRPLRTPEHFRRFIGEKVFVKAREQNGRGAWTGTLLDMRDDTVVLEVDGAAVYIPFDSIKRAHLKGVVDFSSKPQA